MWEMAFFGLKLGLDLEMRAAHPHQKFNVTPVISAVLKSREGPEGEILVWGFCVCPRCLCGFYYQFCFSNEGYGFAV